MGHHDDVQQANSQAQAGVASQVVINLFFVTPDGVNWTVKPLVSFEQVNGSPIPSTRAESVGADMSVEAERGSNAQGQGMAILNRLDLEKVLQALNTATAPSP